MKYYAARALQDGAGWKWTCQHGSTGPILTEPCCLECSPHPTQEAAQHCALDYTIKHRTVVDTASHPCSKTGQICETALQLGTGIPKFMPLSRPYLDDIAVIKELYLRMYGLPHDIASSY